MNTFQDNFFDFKINGELNLHYCGNRENSVNHKYTHKQNAFLLTLVVSGEATLLLNNKKCTLSAGDFYIMYPNSSASYTTKNNTPWSIRWVTVTGTLLESLLSALGFSPSQPVLKLSNPTEAELILKKLFVITLKDDLKSKISAFSLLYNLFSCLAESSSTSIENPVISNAIEYISGHYNENISIKSLAQHAFLNANYFSKLFTSKVGVTPQQFIIRTRLEKAKELLKYTNLTLKEIAITIGFSDSLYFSRIFKLNVGVSPSDFRKNQP